MNNFRATEEVHKVERILDDRMYRGRKQYLIKWAGCTDDENTWEFKSSLFCERLLQEYEREKCLRVRKDSKGSLENPVGNRSTRQSQERIVLLETESGLMEVRLPEKQARFEQCITNEWHEAVKKVTAAYINESGALEVEFVTINGQSGTCAGCEMRYKAPLKLLDFYEENLDFPE